MNDVSFFWIAFAAYLAAMFLLVTAALRRGGERLASAGRSLVWLGLAAHTTSIVWRALLLGTQPVELFFERMGAALAHGPAWQATVYGLVAGVAALAAAIGVVFRRRRPVWLVSAGVAVVLELVLLDFLDFARVPVEKVYEYLSLASWCSAVALLAASPVVRLVVIDAALAMAASLLTVFAAIQPKTIELQLVPALQSYWLFIHVSLTSVAYAVFGIAFVVAALFVVKAYRPSAVARGTKRRALLASALAKALAAGLVAGLVLGGVVLPFRQVAYAPHQLQQGAGEQEDAEGELPPVGGIQVVRYGAALVGAFGTASYVLFWLLFAFLRPRGEGSGFASYLFVVTSVAVFVACLVLGGLVRGQEQAIRQLGKERRELDRLLQWYAPHEGMTLSRTDLAADVGQARALASQARTLLAEARWLPVTVEDQEALAGDRLFKSLQALYRDAGREWRLPIRYKDIKAIGRAMGQQADTTEAVARRLELPASREELQEARMALVRRARSRESGALLPRLATGKVAAFVGFALLMALPLGLALYWLLPRLGERLPAAERLDRVSYSAIAIGYPLFTFGALFAGAIWAHFAWGSWWSWDPKEVGSLVAWVLYTIYLHQRYREGMSPRAAATAGMVGFLAATLSLAGNAFLGGLHAYS